MFKINIKQVKIFGLLLMLSFNFLMSSEERVILGKAPLSERDAKRFSKFGNKTNYKDKEEIQRRITEIVSTAITPLEWKTIDNKDRESLDKTSKMDKKDSPITESIEDEDLPF